MATRKSGQTRANPRRWESGVLISRPSPYLWALATLLIRRRDLLIQLVGREISVRYKGSASGMLWTLINPLLMLAIYTVVFVFFLRTGPSGRSGPFNTGLFIFAGLIMTDFFMDCLALSPGILSEQRNYIKNVLVPSEMLVCDKILSSFFHAFIGVGIFLFMSLAIQGNPRPTAVFFPIALLPLFLFTLGVSFAISAVSVFWRDVKHIVVFIGRAMLFLSPVFYSLKDLPVRIQKLMVLYTLAVCIETMRIMVLDGNPPDWKYWVVAVLISAATASTGYAFFKKSSTRFAEEI